MYQLKLIPDSPQPREEKVIQPPKKSETKKPQAPIEPLVWKSKPKPPSPEERAEKMYNVAVTRGGDLYSTDGWDKAEAIAIDWIEEGIGICEVIEDAKGFKLIRFQVGEKTDFFYSDQLLKVEGAKTDFAPSS